MHDAKNGYAHAYAIVAFHASPCPCLSKAFHVWRLPRQAAPIGLVTKVPESCRIELVRSDGSSAAAEDGSDVAELRVYEASGEWQQQGA